MLSELIKFMFSLHNVKKIKVILFQEQFVINEQLNLHSVMDKSYAQKTCFREGLSCQWNVKNWPVEQWIARLVPVFESGEQ